MNIQVAANGIVHDTTADGPHLRDSIYLQGCSIHCKDCHNKHLWDPKGGVSMDIADLVSQVHSNYVTILGGEPFDQIDALYELLLALQGRNIWVYTGYTYDQLFDSFDPKVHYCLHLIDTLVYGPYIKELPKACFRGSSNQRILDLHTMSYAE